MVKTERKLTGRHVALIFVAAFAVIIGVNILLAYNAVTSFPGLEVKNSYVASQEFNDRRDAQLALGWQVEARADQEQLRVWIADADNTPVRVKSLAATLGRATHVQDDQTPELSFDGMAYVAPVTLAPGNWNLRMKAVSADGVEFTQRIILHVREERK
ncbi:FixH family protein [Epibacterium ulvae]|uniref:FixH family protein n=1 Tax=Epibacterium ulvae TaxID=1156985 RepID=UPI0024915468|nr:FixH family protein [Epibacterium ulvae]